LRALPIFLAQQLANLAAESKKWALIFIVVMFFGLPLLMILLTR